MMMSTYKGGCFCGVARLLTKALPRVEVLEFEKLGHMGPVTHPEPVNKAIERFLERD
jgi:pimeloyl-ACP methyl ester carboxylesterase